MGLGFGGIGERDPSGKLAWETGLHGLASSWKQARGRFSWRLPGTFCRSPSRKLFWLGTAWLTCPRGLVSLIRVDGCERPPSKNSELPILAVRQHGTVRHAKPRHVQLRLGAGEGNLEGDGQHSSRQKKRSRPPARTKGLSVAEKRIP